MTYEYLCTSCEHVWEAEQSISEAPLKTCPHCKKDTAKRQVSGGAGFILKGGGWYADLYGSSPKKSPDDASSSAGSTKAETKKADAPSKDTSSSTKETSTSTTSSDSGSKGSSSGSGNKGGADSSAA